MTNPRINTKYSIASGGSIIEGDCSSSLGVAWNLHSAEAINWRSVVYGNGKFVAVSEYYDKRIMTSNDGVSWTTHTAPEQNSWYSVTFGNGRFVAVSSDGDNRVMTFCE